MIVNGPLTYENMANVPRCSKRTISARQVVRILLYLVESYRLSVKSSKQEWVYGFVKTKKISSIVRYPGHQSEQSRYVHHNERSHLLMKLGICDPDQVILELAGMGGGLEARFSSVGVTTAELLQQISASDKSVAQARPTGNKG